MCVCVYAAVLRCVSHTSFFFILLRFPPVAGPDCVYAELSPLRAKHNLLII